MHGMCHERLVIFVVLALVTGLVIGCGSAQVGPSGHEDSDGTSMGDEAPQLGLNFIRFFWSEKPGRGPDTSTEYYQPAWIFDDFADLGVQAYRQLVKADLLWDVVEPKDDQWNWEQADAVLSNPDFTPIVTLFRMQYASPNPPWAGPDASFQKSLGPEAVDYLEHVLERYGPYVKYWEIGNEMDHWRATDPASKPPSRTEKLPDCLPEDGFSPQEQGVFLAQVAQFIRDHDPDAVIVMPGMGSLDGYCLNTWLPGVIEGGGKGCFDIVNYHYYGSWEPYAPMRDRLSEFLEQNQLGDKPVWLTETGSTADPTLSIRTNYPNSPESQAADVFRRIVQAYGHGDSLVNWHTYISSPNTGGDSAWRLYGTRTDTAQALPSYQSFKLLAQKLIPFQSVEAISCDPRGSNIYRVVTISGDVRYVAWGSGEFLIPAGTTRITGVVPGSGGDFTCREAQPGTTIALSPIPVLVE